MPTRLEMVFNFTPDDLATNQNGNCTDRQVEKLSAYRRVYLKRVGRVIVALTIFFSLSYLASIINVLLYDGSVIALIGFTFYFPFFVGSSVLPWYRLQFRWHTPLGNRQAAYVPNVLKQHFILQKQFSAKGFQTIFQYEQGGSRFRLTPDQYAALDDEKSYYVYYFPAKDNYGNHPILSMEEQVAD